MTRMPLPIDDALPALLAALRSRGRAVLQAPPGAGKTTRVPLAILEAGLTTGRILMLEPRRLATRAAASRMAATLGEKPGETVGYRIRGESKTSPATRIEVVTEGILTRMIQSDPELTGVGAVIFDEFHERSLQADLGLALTLDLSVLRPDLMILVMSATLDAAPVAALMEDAPLVTSEGRAYPVEIHHLPRPLPREARLETAVTELILEALPKTQGAVLVFLPGEGEIRRVERALAPRLPANHVIRPLYGTLPPAAQDQALAPDPANRKIVLATNIAETSLTIPDVTVVVDAGLARRARFDAGTGMSRLVTDRVTRAEATQRTGRAGRVAAGSCFRLWAKAEEGALAAFPPPEITNADLTGLALDLAMWGSDRLPFLTPPPEAALTEARALLRDLGALDAHDAITAHGRRLAQMPLHPRLAHMLSVAGKQAAPLAALLSERDPLYGAGADLTLRLDAVAGKRAGDPAILERIRSEAKRLARDLPEGEPLSHGAMAALAYPDRIGQRRAGDAPRFHLTGGKGAVMAAGDGLSHAPYVVVTDSDGDPREAQVRAALPLTEADLRALYGTRIRRQPVITWSPRENRVLARDREMLGAVVLSERNLATPDPQAMARAMCEGIRSLGLRLSGKAKRLQTRALLARQADPDLPDLSDDALLATLEDWLAPYLSGVKSAADWAKFDPYTALSLLFDHGQKQRLDKACPAHFTTPLGRQIAVDYEADVPTIEIRLQEMFGVTRHPMAGGTPIRVTLLSPGQKPIQVTQDIPNFWRTSYADVRKDMRGRYPRHPWPEDPTEAEPTLRAKPRGT